MLARIATGVTLGAVVLGALALGSVAVAVLAGLLAILAVAELYALQRAQGLRPIPFVGFAAIIALIVIAHAFGERAPSVFPAAVAAAFVLVAATLVMQRRIDGATKAVAASMLGVVYVGVLAAYLVVLRRSAHGTKLVLALVVLVVANDVASFAIGRWRGRHVLAPSISPRKTWEGLLAGTAGTFIAAAVLAATMDPPFDRARATIAAVVIAFAAPLGDLVASMLKRDAGAKDAGTILPGHGGVLDRIDGILLAAPLFFYAWRTVAR